MGAVLTGCALSVYKKPAQAYEQPERVEQQGMAPKPLFLSLSPKRNIRQN